MRREASGFLALFVIWNVQGSPQCLDENGNPVDWWVILKAPIITSSSNTHLRDGYGYGYADGKTSLSMTSNGLDQASGALANTLVQIYNGGSSLGWIMYDDESPNGDTHDSYGHTKGDVALDSNGGFWLVHSVPRFPNYTSYPYQFPYDERDYGQSFLCMTLDVDQFETVGQAFLLNKPAVFDINLPSSVLRAVPSFADVQSKQWNKTAGSTARSIRDTGGQTYTVFATNAEADLNLYSDVVEPHFNSGMMVESWMNGEDSNKMPTYCKPQYPYDTINVRNVELDGIGWAETQDHSKWGILIDKSGYTCIGDKNRQFSQAKRGGGTVCFHNSAIYGAFKGLITNADSC